MNPVLLGIGVVLLVAAVVDLLWTTLWVEGGAGPISKRLMASTWRVLRVVCAGRSRALSLAGPTLVVLTFAVWIGLLWAGWTFVFAAGQSALVETHDQSPIGWIDRLYFVAYTLFTLGIGDIVPRDGVWQLATVFATGTGMLFITTGVSYVVSVLEAVSRKRSFASTVTALGFESETIVEKGWTGTNFDGFGPTLDELASEIDYVAYQNKAYPILQYYHTERDEHSVPVGIAVFDEAVTLLRFGMSEESRPNTVLLETAHSSTESYLETLDDVFARPADRTPTPPDLQRLRDAGIPTVTDQEFVDSLDELEGRRRRLLGMVEADARRWPSAMHEERVSGSKFD